MKIDPITGKAYCHDWERDLNRLWKAGYSYGYLSWINPQTNEEIFQVDAMKGDGPRIVCQGSTIAEAKNNLKIQLKRLGWIKEI